MTITYASKVCCQDQMEENQSYKNLIGGSFSFNSSENIRNIVIVQGSLLDNLTKNNSFNFSPYYLRSLNSSVKVGFILNYSRSKFDRESPVFSAPIIPFPEPVPGVERVNTSISVNEYIGTWLFARINIKNFNRLNAFLEPMLGFINSNTETESINWINSGNEQQISRNESLTNTFNIRVNVGLTYALSDRWNVITRLGNVSYETGNIEENFVSSTSTTSFSDFSEVDISDFNINFRPINFSLGVEFNF